MRAPAIVRRHPEVVWLVAAGVVVALVIAAVSGISGTFRDESSLPATSPEQLVNEVRATHEGGYSGQITTNLSLDLPPSLTRAVHRAVPMGGGLLTGAHTLRYWYGDADRQRTAVVGQDNELDVFRNGSQLLYWDTRTKTAVRTSTSDRDRDPLPLALAAPPALTPPQLADRLIDLVATSGDVSLRSGPVVAANRETYELVMRPDNAGSLIDEVHIQVDGREAVPLGVQVYVRGQDRAAINVSFTSVNFATPSARNFTFRPPTTPLDGVPTAADAFATDASDVAAIGKGWVAAASYRSQAVRAAPVLVRRVLGTGQIRVKGAWGTGRLLQTPMLTVLLTSTGRLLAGPVVATVLYRAVSA